jgi:hypothetical protein
MWSKHGCLIINPASHLKLHGNLQGAYFMKISMGVKLTCDRPYAPPAHIELDLEGIPYRSLHEKTNLPEYIKKKLHYEESTKGTNPILEDRVQISQLIRNMNNGRSRYPFQFSRTTEWVSPSGESVSVYPAFDRISRNPVR